jgi:hypothetical protein
MWKLRRSARGVTLVQMLVGGFVIVIVVTAVIDTISCDAVPGSCTSVSCTSAAPCAVDLNGDGKLDECIVGTACTNPGTVCEKHWFGANCSCATVPGTGMGSCKSVCRK